MPASPIDKLLAERVGIAGEISVSDILALVKHKFKKTWTQRIYLYTNLRWISNVDINFGTDDVNSTENADTGADPLVEWENIGEPVQKGDYLDTLEIRSRTNSLEVTEVEILVMYVRPDPITRWETGYDNDNEIHTEEIHRDFWVNNSQGVMQHPINDRGRRLLKLDFTVPEDGELRVFFKPSGNITTTRFFYANFMLRGTLG